MCEKICGRHMDLVDEMREIRNQMRRTKKWLFFLTVFMGGNLGIDGVKEMIPEIAKFFAG